MKHGWKIALPTFPDIGLTVLGCFDRVTYCSQCFKLVEPALFSRITISCLDMQDQLIPMKRPLPKLINRSCWSWNQVSEWIFIGISGASDTIYSAWWYLGHEGRHSHKIVNNILIEHPLTFQYDSCLSWNVLNQVLGLHPMKSMERTWDRLKWNWRENGFSMHRGLEHLDSLLIRFYRETTQHYSRILLLQKSSLLKTLDIKLMLIWGFLYPS